jgi:hypothetical protein
MRGLLMAIFAFNFPGHGNMVSGDADRAFPRSTKTVFLAKKTGKTTTKTV